MFREMNEPATIPSASKILSLPRPPQRCGVLSPEIKIDPQAELGEQGIDNRLKRQVNEYFSVLLTVSGGASSKGKTTCITSYAQKSKFACVMFDRFCWPWRKAQTEFGGFRYSSKTRSS